MWGLVVSELADQSMYKNQKLLFMGTIKAQVRAIYSKGRKAQSAFFGPTTKPIFRSESARYVLFIQMSKEMWDFDADGTGEIMFHKVINGFLPDLFGRWEKLMVRHLVSIILFTRLEYQQNMPPGFPQTINSDSDPGTNAGSPDQPYKDFYRVLVSDMASGQWGAILTQLKKEFKVFLRDVSIRTTSSADKLFPDPIANSDELLDTIAGRPTAASHGNILEAINLASSQFSGDYIDRDLVRTGLSIVVITPGTGVFEVDHTMLDLTTDTLIESGIGIDLVCLSPMPLHSVPLFKYRAATQQPQLLLQTSNNKILKGDLVGSLQSTGNETLASEVPQSKDNLLQDSVLSRNRLQADWRYAIPHWIDVSFWTARAAFKNFSNTNRDISLVDKTSPDAFKQKLFIPRVRMYEVQMMGIMENEMSSISIPYLPLPPGLSSSINTGVSKSEQIVRSQKLYLGGLDIGPKSFERSLQSFSSSVSPTQSSITKTHESLLQWMDDHDERLFHNRQQPYSQTQRPWGSVPLLVKADQLHNEGHGIFTTNNSVTTSTARHTGHQLSETASHKSVVRRDLDLHRKPAGTAKIPIKALKRTNLSRQISFGLRGFGGAAPKAIPITEISSENAQSASLLSRGLRLQRSAMKSSLGPPTNEELEKQSSSGSESDHTIQNHTYFTESDHDRASKPIAIKSAKVTTEPPLTPTFKETGDFKTRSQGESLSKIEYEQAQQQAFGLSSGRAMAPWLTMLNPSNPHETIGNAANHLGRWHHVFPRPIRASNIKWKSLCSPASVPLTTEDFPSKDQLKAEYIETDYKISVFKDNDLSEDSKSDQWLMRELVNARLSHGFQVIVGTRLSLALGDPSLEIPILFTNNDLGKRDTQFFMSRGGTIHHLYMMDDGVIQVLQFTRRSMTSSAADIRSSLPLIYLPAVRTTLSELYIARQVEITSAGSPYDWQRLDTFIAGHEEQRVRMYPDPLQCWRARFVLIPKERPLINRKGLYASTEDNDEEIRLEGIRKLTQLWQKNRYIPADERRFQNTSRRWKDPNPLDIIYQTRNPSAVVAAELNDAHLLEAEGGEMRPSQLLPDNELLESANLNLASLAQTIQSEQGVKMMDRRWHLRLHYNCFIGMELTTWILSNFKDIESRDEAVDLGNELMKQGLFQHVERRHNFRDGNFFYQISSEFRVPRPEVRTSWFGSKRSDRSVPSTPISEVIKNSPTGFRSRSNSIGHSGSDEEASTPTRKQKLGVALSGRIVYDVDPRKRSYRQELMTLHYDRISSADDCYHLRIDWMNVTPKLIEDTIVQWATAAERNGLRLVELPIGEASKINEFHPFRAPYTVKLAKHPPETRPPAYFDSTSLGPRGTTTWPYHKALLKRFNFVLDLEAAKDFPPSVDVTYSWGKPDYRYPQYISREGILLAQITDNGDFLLLANRLFNNRSAAVRDPSKSSTHVSDEANTRIQHSPARGYGSPPVSPAMRAIPDVGLGFATAEMVTPEKIAFDLEAFCHDVEALDAFYKEVQHRSGPSAPSTPAMDSIAPLTQPPAFSLRDSSPAAKKEVSKGAIIPS